MINKALILIEPIKQFRPDLLERMQQDILHMRYLFEQLAGQGIAKLVVNSGYALEGLRAQPFSRFHLDCDVFIASNRPVPETTETILDLMPDWVNIPTKPNNLWLQSRLPAIDSDAWESDMQNDFINTPEPPRDYNIHILQSPDPFSSPNIPVIPRSGHAYELQTTTGEFVSREGVSPIELPVLTKEMWLVSKLRAWHTLRYEGIRDKDVYDLRLMLAEPGIDYDVVLKHLTDSVHSNNAEAIASQLLQDALSSYGPKNLNTEI